MGLQKSTTWRFMSAVLLMLMVFNGCASGESLVGPNQISVEKHSSEMLTIKSVYIHRTVAGIEVNGEVLLATKIMGDPPDIIVITLINPAGKVLNTSDTQLYRNGRATKPTNVFKFSLTIPIVAPRGSVLKVTTRDG